MLAYKLHPRVYISIPICKHHLKRPKTSKCDTLLRFFNLGPTDALSTLEWKNLVYWDFIFHLGSTEPSVKLKKITRNQGHLGLSESYDPTDPERSQRSLKDPDCFWQVGL